MRFKQRTHSVKKTVFDSPGLVDLTVKQVHFILHLRDGQVKFLGVKFEKIQK